MPYNIGGSDPAQASEEAVRTSDLLYDPTAPGFHDDPYPFYHRLREQDPVHWSPYGVWFLTRYDDVLAALRDRRFSSRSISFGSATQQPIPPEALGGLEEVLLVGVPVFSDPPDHTRLRKLANRAFAPRVVEGMKPYVQQIVDRLLDAVEPNGGMDVVTDLATPLPLTVICEMLGIPLDDHELFRSWASDIATVADADQTADTAMHALQALQAVREYFRDLIARRRGNPRGDLLDALIAAEEEGDRLTEPELVGMCQTLFIAGHETTASFLGNAVAALLRHPDQAALLRERSDLVGNAVEELLRYDTSVQLAPAPRVATEDIEIGGRLIEQGQSVRLLLGAGNRDPARFPDPDRLDLEREDPHHLSFAGGIHTCLGAPLARIEARSALATLFRRMPGIRLATEHLDWQPSSTVRALRALPVEF